MSGPSILKICPVSVRVRLGAERLLWSDSWAGDTWPARLVAAVGNGDVYDTIVQLAVESMSRGKSSADVVVWARADAPRSLPGFPSTLDPAALDPFEPNHYRDHQRDDHERDTDHEDSLSSAHTAEIYAVCARRRRTC
jgi:hypothetical protein